MWYVNTDYWPHDTTLWVKDFKGNHPRFIYYFFKYLAPLLASLDVGSANPTLNRNHVHPTEVSWPPLSEQRAIASILGALDDKIDLNRRMNGTLEELARTIFKSWFLDFDPVRAKAEGREPVGMDAETAALFPSRFVESELGQIPEGWSTQPIGNAVDVVGGSTPSTTEASFWDGEHAWVTPKDLAPLNTPILLHTSRRITESGLNGISSGLLPVGTVLLSSRAPIGYLAIAWIPTAINQGFIAMKEREGGPGRYFLLNWARSSLETIKGRANGTTFLEISKSSFRPIPVVLAPAATLRCFEQIVAPFYLRIAGNEQESKVLTDLRDLLLPKLISGELRVPDAEKVAEAVL